MHPSGPDIPGASRMVRGTFLSVRDKYYRSGADKFSLIYIISTAFSLQTRGSFWPNSIEPYHRIHGERYLLATDTSSVHPHLP